MKKNVVAIIAFVLLLVLALQSLDRIAATFAAIQASLRALIGI